MNDRKDYFVVKSNDFIRNTQTNLTVKQQQLVLYVISLIMPDSERLKYSFSIKDYLGNKKALGGASYRKVKNDLEKIQSECFCYNDGKKIVSLPIFREVNITNQSGVVEVVLNWELRPYFYQLRTNYTQYLLSNVLKLSHKHSIELYEYFKSYEYAHEKTHFVVKKSINDIKFKINVLNKNEYSTFTQLNKKILKPAVEEINANTDINVTLSPVRTGRSVTHVNIYVKQKEEKQGNHNTKHIDFLEDLREPF